MGPIIIIIIIIIIINTWSQLVTEDALEKNFSPDACAKSPVNLQASCQFIFSVSCSFSTYFTTPHGREGPYSRWGRRPEPEALKDKIYMYVCNKDEYVYARTTIYVHIIYVVPPPVNYLSWWF